MCQKSIVSLVLLYLLSRNDGMWHNKQMTGVTFAKSTVNEQVMITIVNVREDVLYLRAQCHFFLQNTELTGN